MKLTIVEKNLLSWTAMHIDFVMCNDVYAKLSSFRYKPKLIIVSKSVTDVWENDFNFSTDQKMLQHLFER